MASAVGVALLFQAQIRGFATGEGPMRSLLALLLLGAAAALQAQEGFPLDGTWRGERPDVAGSPVTIVMVMQWDGHKVTGVINPGPAAMQIVDAKLIPNGWR